MTTGITFGAYDLFHIGHVKLLQHAAEHCDRLIVGVSTSDRIYKYKHKRPVFSDSDRLNIVSSCRYVDYAFLNDGDPNDLESYFKHVKNYGATKWFVGSDWQGTEKWKKIESLLKDCEIVYLPHTDGISTTDIIKQIKTRD